MRIATHSKLHAGASGRFKLLIIKTELRIFRFHDSSMQDLPTIQGTLEQVISGIDGRVVQVAGSGRTDAGVHALAQVAAFSIENPIPVANLVRAANRLLPFDIRIIRAE